MQPRSMADLRVYQLAHEFQMLVLTLVKEFGPASDHKLRSQLLDAALSTASSVDEGYYRFNAGEFIRFLDYSQASRAEAVNRLEAGVVLGHYPAARVAECLAVAERLARNTARFRAYLVRKRNEKRDRRRRTPPA